MKKYILLFSFLFALTVRSFAGGIGLGASAIYNFQTKSLGFGARLNMKPDNGFRVIPQFSYYPSFNKINEYYLGLGFEANLYKIKKYSLYALVHGGYNHWSNSSLSKMEGAQVNNWVFEGGLGVTRNKGCWRPFAEWRYNVKWKEGNFRIGIIYVFKCNDKGYAAINKRRRRPVSCPAYN